MHCIDVVNTLPTIDYHLMVIVSPKVIKRLLKVNVSITLNKE